MSFSVPSLINRTTNDITQVQTLVAMGLQILIKSPIMAVWAIIKIVNKSWTLSAITAGFVVALLVMMVLIIGIVVPRFRRVQKLVDKINSVARENLTGINVVHAYNAEDYQNEKFEKGNVTLMKTQLFNQRAFALLMPSVTLAMNALSLVIYWVGAALVNNVPSADAALRLTTFSDIVVFGTYATYVIMSIMMMVMIIMLIPAAQVSAQRHQCRAGHRTQPAGGDENRRAGKRHGGIPGCFLPLSVVGQGRSEPYQLYSQAGGNRRLYRRYRQRQDHSGQPHRPVL